MAFPTTGVLDDANRADTGPPPSASWSQLGWAGAAGMKVVSNTFRFAVADTAAGDYLNTITPGPDCEAFVTITTKQTTGDYSAFTLDLRISSPGSSTLIDSYEIEVIYRESGANVNIVRIWKGVNGAYTQQGADISTTVTNGDQFGGRVTGGATTTIEAFRNGTSVGSRTDSSSPITAAGNIALGGYVSNDITLVVLDNFGGGTLKSLIYNSNQRNFAGLIVR